MSTYTTLKYPIKTPRTSWEAEQKTNWLKAGGHFLLEGGSQAVMGAETGLRRWEGPAYQRR